jgi:threonine/homoserine/homoserine lactone efflux protein
MMEWLGLTQTAHFGVFFVMVFGIIVLPGMDMAFVMASALVGGRKAGWAAVAGIVAGGMVHTLMGFVGVGLVIKTMPQLFNAMLLAGSVYIAWIGWSLLRGAGALGDVPEGAARPVWSTFGRAAATCLLNPKAYIFMLAVFPQFLRPDYGPMGVQAVVLGVIISVTQIVVYGTFAMGAAGIRVWLRHHQRGQVRLGQAVGMVLIVAAAWTAWQGWRMM